MLNTAAVALKEPNNVDGEQNPIEPGGGGGKFMGRERFSR